MADCLVLSVSRVSNNGGSGKLRLGAIQLQGGASVNLAAESRRKLSERPKTLDELRAALVCMDASMSAILSRLTVGAGVEKLERSDLGEHARHHLTRWVRGDISGRYCFLLLEQELKKKKGNVPSISNQPGKNFNAATDVMDMLGALVGLMGDNSWHWSGSWLYDNVFAMPPATVLKEAVEALVAVAQSAPEDDEGVETPETPTKGSSRPRSQLVADEINLAFRRLAMRAAPFEEGKQKKRGAAAVGAGSMPGAAVGHEYIRTQVWKELFHIHANGEDEKDTPLAVPEGTEDLLERDDGWLHALISRPANSIQMESEASTTEELKKANDQLSGYIKGAMQLKKRLGEQVKWLERMSAYSMLGVTRNASNVEIKRAYRELAIKHHPDKGGDADKFQELQRAYESIVEERKRTGDKGGDGGDAKHKDKKKKKEKGAKDDSKDEKEEDAEEEIEDDDSDKENAPKDKDTEGGEENEEDEEEGPPLKTAAEIMAEDPTEDEDMDLQYMVRQVAALAASARDEADKSGASAQHMLTLLKSLEAGPNDLDATAAISKEALDLSAKGSGHSESAGTNALAVAQKALGLKGKWQAALSATESGTMLATYATKSADAGVLAVERSLAALRTYNEMSTTQRTAELRMSSWRARGVVDDEMEQISCELHRATLKTINQAIKDCAKSAIDAAVAACEVSRLLHVAVTEMIVHQQKMEEEAAEAEAKRREEEERREREGDNSDDEKQEEEEKKAENEEELPTDPVELEKRLHVMLRVKNTLLLKEVNGNILKLQNQMQHLLQTRLFSLEHCVISPEQKENLFATVAELFDHSCGSFELAAAAHLAAEHDGEHGWQAPGWGATWWEAPLDETLGWVTAAVEKREVAVPSPRAQILRLAALVDSNALGYMAEKELFGNVEAIIHKLAKDRVGGASTHEDADMGAEPPPRFAALDQRCGLLLAGIQQMISEGVLEPMAA